MDIIRSPPQCEQLRATCFWQNLSEHQSWEDVPFNCRALYNVYAFPVWAAVCPVVWKGLMCSPAPFGALFLQAMLLLLQLELKDLNLTYLVWSALLAIISCLSSVTPISKRLSPSFMDKEQIIWCMQWCAQVCFVLFQKTSHEMCQNHGRRSVSLFLVAWCSSIYNFGLVPVLCCSVSQTVGWNPLGGSWANFTWHLAQLPELKIQDTELWASNGRKVLCSEKVGR